MNTRRKRYLEKKQGKRGVNYEKEEIDFRGGSYKRIKKTVSIEKKRRRGMGEESRRDEKMKKEGTQFLLAVGTPKLE